jgi:hypothetical protein
LLTVHFYDLSANRYSADLPDVLPCQQYVILLADNLQIP